MATVASVNVLLSASTEGFSKGLNKAKAELGEFAGMTKQLNSLLAGLGIGFSIAGLTAAIEEFNNAQHSFVKLDVAVRNAGDRLGYTTKQLDDYAERLQYVVGIQDDDLKAAMATLATFSNVSGETFRRAIPAIIDYAKATGTDVVNAFDKWGRALQNPAEFLTRLDRAGFEFTAQQRDQIQALIDSNDLLGAQAEILKVLEERYKGTAEAMVTSWDKAKIRIGNLVEWIGEKLDTLQKRFEDTFTMKDIESEFMQRVNRNLGLEQPDQQLGLPDPAKVDAVAKSIGGISDAMGGIDESTRKTQAAMADWLSKLQMQVDTFGMSAERAKIYEMALNDAVTTAQLGQAQALVDMLENKEKQKRAEEDLARAQKHQQEQTARMWEDLNDKMLRDREQFFEDMTHAGERWFEETRTPAERLQSQIEELNNLFQWGAIDADTYQRAIGKLKEQIEAASGTALPQGMEYGSQAAESAINQAMNAARQQSSALDPNGPFAAAIPILDDIRKNTKNSTVAVGAI